MRIPYNYDTMIALRNKAWQLEEKKRKKILELDRISKELKEVYEDIDNL